MSKLLGTIGMISASIQNTLNILKLLLLFKIIHEEGKNYCREKSDLQRKLLWPKTLTIIQ